MSETVRNYAENFDVLNGHQFMNFTSFYQSGRAVTTPVWFVEYNGKIFLWTNVDSYKVKRVQATGQVEVGGSDSRGTVLSPVVKAQARVIEDEPDFANTLLKAMIAKYGLMFHGFRLMAFLMRNKNIFLEVTL